MIDPSEVLYHMFLVWNEDIPLHEMQPERVFFLYLSFLVVVADNASLFDARAGIAVHDFSMAVNHALSDFFSCSAS